MDTGQWSRAWSRLVLVGVVVLLGGGALLHGRLVQHATATHDRPVLPQSGTSTAVAVSSPD